MVNRLSFRLFALLALALVENYGVKPGNRVLIRSANNPAMVACWLAATKAGATVSERGSVTSGDQKLDAELDKAVQGTGLRAVGDGSLTPVVKVGERYSVAYVRDLKKATTRPLGEVKAQLEPQVLNEKQTAAMQALAHLTDDHAEGVSAALEKREARFEGR